MIVYRIAKCKFIKQLNGYGAYLYGGRWNSVNQFMLYTSCNPSTAVLECLVHFSINEAPTDYCIASIEIPDEDIGILNTKVLPDDWQVSPAPIALKQIGDAFLQQQKYLALKVPCSILEMEYNVLINPMHPRFNIVRIVQEQNFAFDKRMLVKK
jgi:RES domain-containing protein